MKALQKALDNGGTITVNEPGIYRLAGTVFIGSNTTLKCANGVKFKKTDEIDEFSHVFCNKGAKNKTYDTNIHLDGVELIINNIDTLDFKVAFGLQGQIGFHYVKDLRIDRFRSYDLAREQYGIHICTFEDVIIDDVIIYGKKDGIHFGTGKRFTVRNGVFQTFDDAIALNAHDYATGNPEYGWIEDGVIEKCYDLNAENTTGYFSRILAGGWVDWKAGNEVQHSDIVVANGRLYRVQMKPDGKKFITNTMPTHTEGMKEYDGITWGVVQDKIEYNCGVRNVTYRDIFLYKPRVAFSIHFDTDNWSRSYYPGAPKPIQSNLVFENVRVLYDEEKQFLHAKTPVDNVIIRNCYLRNNHILFNGNRVPMDDFELTNLTITDCYFAPTKEELVFLQTNIKNKKVLLQMNGNILKSGSSPLKTNIKPENIDLIDQQRSILNKNSFNL
jgi:hypothetical protein